jgi:co-chaperonin GroES (HSP10)
MIEVILNRVLVELEEIKKSHKVAGTNIEIPLAYGELEKRHNASVVQGVVVSIGPDAYNDYDEVYRLKKPIKVGDRVQFAKFSPSPVSDPDQPEKRLAMLNDEDILGIITSKEKTNE